MGGGRNSAMRIERCSVLLSPVASLTTVLNTFSGFARTQRSTQAASAPPVPPLVSFTAPAVVVPAVCSIRVVWASREGDSCTVVFAQADPTVGRRLFEGFAVQLSKVVDDVGNHEAQAKVESILHRGAQGALERLSVVGEPTGSSGAELRDEHRVWPPALPQCGELGLERLALPLSLLSLLLFGHYGTGCPPCPRYLPFGQFSLLHLDPLYFAHFIVYFKHVLLFLLSEFCLYFCFPVIRII